VGWFGHQNYIRWWQKQDSPSTSHIEFLTPNLLLFLTLFITSVILTSLAFMLYHFNQSSFIFSILLSCVGF
jgi:hypothetical protein